MTVADTILQEKVSVALGGASYEVAPPSIATLILCSEDIALLPFKEQWNRENIVLETLREAKYCRPLGRIIATLILGAQVVQTKPCRWLWWKNGERKRNRLARRILETSTPQEVNAALAKILQTLQVGDFFGLTISLIEINITKPTKEMVKQKKTKATASGQQ